MAAAGGLILPIFPPHRKKKGRNAYRGAFAADRGKRLSGGIRAVLLGMAILSGLAVYGERLLKTREAEFTALSRLTRDETERINATAALKAEIEELETRLKEAETAAHIDPWLFLNRLAPLMPRGTRIRNLSTRGDSFALELSSGEAQESALGLGDALSRESGFADIIFQEVRILQESPDGPHLSRYRLTGTFYSSFQPLQAKEDL
ncbi:hypothetical protein [Marispirochaeta sp.]|uniref:hypothetical protein n=1 Tax=Marispirochaeta sp. TaxID=2038653 RepID=UPI0029C93649|nr:hypothetical protein [Marispirochaeta sp.]